VRKEERMVYGRTAKKWKGNTRERRKGDPNKFDG
jgi:hypothetical protein